MPGIQGMTTRRPRMNAVRRRVWQSMRILRRFTLPDLCRTASASMSNVRKFVRRLESHGYVAKHGRFVGGRAGEYQAWRLVHDIGPDYPMRCERCGRPLGETCEPQVNGETPTGGKNDEPMP